MESDDPLYDNAKRPARSTMIRYQVYYCIIVGTVMVERPWWTCAMRDLYAIYKLLETTKRYRRKKNSWTIHSRGYYHVDVSGHLHLLRRTLGPSKRRWQKRSHKPRCVTPFETEPDMCYVMRVYIWKRAPDIDYRRTFYASRTYNTCVRGIVLLDNFPLVLQENTL